MTADEEWVNSREIVFDVAYYDLFDHDTSTSRTHFVNFAAFTVSMTLNIDKGSFKVIHFGGDRKLVSDFI